MIEDRHLLSSIFIIGHSYLAIQLRHPLRALYAAVAQHHGIDRFLHRCDQRCVFRSTFAGSRIWGSCYSRKLSAVGGD
jgi:hypothetical protein